MSEPMAPGEYETVPETCGVCRFNFKALCADNLLINVDPAKPPPSGEAPHQCPRKTWAQRLAMGLVG
jgi:hypothetical protein